jgi:hypothetical protein
MIPGTSFSKTVINLLEVIIKKKKTGRNLDVPGEANRKKIKNQTGKRFSENLSIDCSIRLFFLNFFH